MKGGTKMKHYLFYDDEIEENFLVGGTDEDDAYDTACWYFGAPELIREVSEAEAESSGLDEY